MGSPTSAVSWIGTILLRRCKMSRLLPSNLLLLVAALLVLLLLVVPSTAEPKPGHMQHQYYKDQEVARRQQLRGRRNGASTLTTVEPQSERTCSSLFCWPPCTWRTTTWYERRSGTDHETVLLLLRCELLHPVATMVIFISREGSAERCDHSHDLSAVHIPASTKANKTANVI